MFKYIFLIIYIVNTFTLFCEEVKPIVKYRTISLNNKLVSVKQNKVNYQIRMISKLDSKGDIYISYDNAVTWIKQNEENLIVFPNPSYINEISFNISNYINDFKLFKIIDFQGNIVQNYKYYEKNGIITINNLKEGKYFLQIIYKKSNQIIPFIIE